ncbi:hypothetical protein D3C71_1751160 [compost metagenome]
MAPADFETAGPGLQVEHSRLERIGQVAPAMHALVQMRLHQMKEEIIQRAGIPLPVHVTLAQAQRALRHDPRIEARVVHRDVLRLVTLHGDPRLMQQPCDPSLQPSVHVASVDQPRANNPATS